jgi:hypothetical protein
MMLVPFSSLLLVVMWAAAPHLRLSDVRVDTQTADVTGTEVTLDRLSGRRVVGTLRHFEGSCEAETIKLSGTLADGRLSASGVDEGAIVRLEGALSDMELRGRLIFELPEQSNVVNVRLRVVPAHVHCQPREGKK